MPLLSFDFDLAAWVATGQGLESGRNIYETSYYMYTPVWGYILSIMTGIGNLFGLSIPGEMMGELVTSARLSTVLNTTITSIAANVLYKFPLLLIDIITAWVLYKIVFHMTSDKKKATLAFGLWFLCPLVIWSSSVACMFDSLSALFTILCFYFMIKENYILSGISFMFAVTTKVFPVILILVILAYIISKHKSDIRAMLKKVGMFIVGGAATFLVVYLPVILTGNLSVSFKFFFSRSETVSGASWNPVSIISSISFNQVIQLAPILIIAFILIGYWMYRSEPEKRDMNMIIAVLLSFTVLFIWPPTPTYPVLLIPFLAMAVTVCGKKGLIWSWGLFSAIMVMTALMIFNIQLLYSLAENTGLLDIGSIISSVHANAEMFSKIEYVFRYLEFIPGISVLVFLYLSRKKERPEEKIAWRSVFG
ncbi:MAG: PIG-U family protein [Candidatus Methanoplasma sp.]|nr:PIG-U family protein [Candidatus Methanoplasma sp.]